MRRFTVSNSYLNVKWNYLRMHNVLLQSKNKLHFFHERTPYFIVFITVYLMNIYCSFFVNDETHLVCVVLLLSLSLVALSFMAE